METFKIVDGSQRTVRAVTPLEDFRLLLEFDNGARRVYDVVPLLRFESFAPLRDPAYFRQVRVIFNYTVGWGDEIDICPSCMYEHSVPA